MNGRDGFLITCRFNYSGQDGSFPFTNNKFSTLLHGIGFQYHANKESVMHFFVIGQIDQPCPNSPPGE